MDRTGVPTCMSTLWCMLAETSITCAIPHYTYTPCNHGGAWSRQVRNCELKELREKTERERERLRERERGERRERERENE